MHIHALLGQFIRGGVLLPLLVVLSPAMIHAMENAESIGMEQSYLGLTMPESIAGMRRNKTIDNEPRKQGLGISIQYDGFEVVAEVDIYDLQLDEISDGPESKLVLNHFYEVLQMFELAVSEGAYDSVELIEKYGTGSPDRGQEFLCAELAIIRDGGAFHSYFYLTGYRGKFVKIRLTMPADNPQAQLARNFADETAKIFWPDGRIGNHAELEEDAAIPDWVQINEFGDSIVFADRASIVSEGSLARLWVKYVLSPPGTDTRNNKPVKEMYMFEEYDTEAGLFRIHQIVFLYTDGEMGEPLGTEQEWTAATEGNKVTLDFLRGSSLH